MFLIIHISLVKLFHIQRPRQFPQGILPSKLIMV